MRWEIDEGLEGAHYIMFSVLLLSLKNNIYQPSPFSSKRQSAPTERLRRHIPAPRGNAPSPDCDPEPSCWATEYIMHMYSFCSKINIVYITGRTILFSLGSSWRVALQQEP